MLKERGEKKMQMETWRGAFEGGGGKERTNEEKEEGRRPEEWEEMEGGGRHPGGREMERERRRSGEIAGKRGQEYEGGSVKGRGGGRSFIGSRVA